MGWLLLALGVFLLSSQASGFGVLLPREPVTSPITTGEGKVDVTIHERLATTRIRQSFHNPNPNQLEADFYFPVPRGAQIVDFALSVNGVMTKAETLPQAQARKIYEDIVRQAKDPGLVEWVDRDLYRIRIFPVPARGKQDIEVSYAQALDADQGLFRYILPIQRPQIQPPARPNPPMPGPWSGRHHQPSPDSSPLPDSTIMPVRVTIQTSEALRMVQSPTHEAKVDRTDDREAILTFADRALAQSPSRTLEVHFLPTRQAVGLAIVATRPLRDEDGYFSLTLAPPWKAPGPDSTGHRPLPPQDVVFVIDTSGSMADRTDKIGQARRALAACLRQLRPEDRFALVRFASDVSSFRTELLPVSSHRESALEWVDRLVARGGTNISGALEEALAIVDRSSTSGTATHVAPATILFLTDGIANVGLTRPEDIIGLAKRPKGRQARLFTFGVGYDVQAVMLDRLAQDTGGSADYVRPDEDLEIPVSRLFGKVSLPAMTNLRLTVDGAEVQEMVPGKIPDLFHGTEVTVLGRYKGSDKPTTATVQVTGDFYGETTRFVASAYFPASDKTAPYLETLWATRKLAALLDNYRGATEGRADLEKEIEQLCLRHNLVSPLTAMLVVEDQPVPASAEPRRALPQSAQSLNSDSWFSQTRSASVRGRTEEARSAPSGAYSRDQEAVSGGEAWRMASGSGAQAVERSLELKKMKSETSLGNTVDRIRQDQRRIENITFVAQTQSDGKIHWVDQRTVSDARPADANSLKIAHLSPAWFELAAQDPWRDILQLGSRISLQWQGRRVEILDSTEEGLIRELTPETRKLLLP